MHLSCKNAKCCRNVARYCNSTWAEGSLNPNTELTICVEPAQVAQGGEASHFSRASNVHGGFHPQNIGPSTLFGKFHHLKVWWRSRLPRAKINLDQITSTTMIKLDQKFQAASVGNHRTVIFNAEQVEHCLPPSRCCI